MSWPAKLRRWLVTIGLILALIVGAAIVLLRVKFEGESLGDSVTDLLDAKMRGRIQIQSIEWPKSSMPTLATGGWIPVTMKGVKVWDAGTPSKLILDVPLVTGEADIHALLFKQQFVFRHIVVDGGWVLLEQVDEAYPLHAYDRTVISLLQAFESPHHTGFATGVYVAGASVIDVQDFTLRHMKVDLHMGNYVSLLDPARPKPAFTFTAGLVDVAARGFLYMDGTDPLVPKLYYALTGPEPIEAAQRSPGLTAGKGSYVNIFDVGGLPGYTIPLASVTLDRVAQLPEKWTGNVDVANSLALSAHAVTTDGAKLAFTGGIDNYFDRPYDGQWAIHIEGQNLGPTLHERFTSIFAGDDVRGSFDLKGPYIALPKIFFTLTGLDLDLPIGAKGDEPLRLAIDRMEGVIDEVNDQIKIDQTVARGAGGEVQLAGTVQLAPLRLDGNVFITKPLDLARWLPKTVKDVLGTRLSGSIHMAGDVSEQLRFDDFTNVALGSARFDRRGVITADHYFDRIYLSRLGITAGSTDATINGMVNTALDTLDLDVVADSKDLATWLRRLGEPAYATSGGGTLRIRDSWAQPRVTGHVYAGGVPMISDVAADIALAGDQLAVDGMQSRGLGGDLRGSGHVTLGATPVVRDFHLSGKDLEAIKIPGTASAASGTIQRAELDVSGPVSRLLIEGGAEADHLDVAGDRYDHVAICINDRSTRARSALARGERRGGTADICTAARPRTPEPRDPDEERKRAEVATACDAAHERGGLCVTARADREAGGTVDVTAVLGRGGALRGALDLVGLPLTALLGPDGPAGGDLDTHVFLGGTTTAPTADGAIELARGWIAGAFLGDASLHVAPAGPGKIAVTGTAMQGRVQIDATVGTTAPYPATITADLRRVDLDPLVDLRPYLHVDDPVHAWASGRITVTTVLGAPSPQLPIDATVALSELSVTIDERDADGRPAPLTVHAASPVRLRYHEGAVDLVCVDPQPGAPPHMTPCPVALSTPAGTITISGSIRPDKLALDATGRLDAALLRPIFSEKVEEAGGTADLEVHLAGTIVKPLVNATLSMNDVWFRPVRQDTVIHLVEGTIGLKDNDDLGFTGMKLTVKDNDTGDLSELDLGGGVKLEDWKPKHWGITLDGELPAKLVLALEPETFSNASGVADLEVFLQGYGAQPAVDGRVSFDDKRPFTLMPRSVRRELFLSEGWINIVDANAGVASGDACHPPKGDPNAHVGALRRYRIDLCKVGGSIDEEGRVRGITGTLDLEDWKLGGGDVTLSADNLPFRIPHVVDATINADTLHLFWDQVARSWNLTGGVEIVTGSYTKQFDVLQEVIKPAASPAQATTPFWEESAAIGNASLDLTVDVRKFSVENNLTTIDMSGQLLISGTPRDPRFDGTIQVGRGEFRFPGSRAKFTRTAGSVTFSRLSRFPNETPSLAIESEADYRDPSGQQHLITLTLDGTLSQLNWNLFTSSGLNKAQTLTLILSGRTPEQFKRQLGNDAVGSDPTHIETSTNPNDSYADQLIKDVAADFISLLVEDSLKDVSRLDVARLEIGTGSIGFHGEKKLTDTTTILGDLEQTVRGRTVYVRGEVKTPFKFTLQFGYLDKTFDDAAEEDVSSAEAKLVYRFFIP